MDRFSPVLEMIKAIFVYGTLQRDQCRCGLWPVDPLSVQQAWTLGTLFTRRDYPAMTPGQDRVLGELWSFRASDVQRVLLTLDRIEGTNQVGEDDLYRRVETESWSQDDQPLVRAYIYHYSTDPVADGFTRLRPSDVNALVRWPAN